MQPRPSDFMCSSCIHRGSKPTRAIRHDTGYSDLAPRTWANLHASLWLPQTAVDRLVSDTAAIEEFKSKSTLRHSSEQFLVLSMFAGHWLPNMLQWIPNYTEFTALNCSIWFQLSSCISVLLTSAIEGSSNQKGHSCHYYAGTGVSVTQSYQSLQRGYNTETCYRGVTGYNT